MLGSPSTESLASKHKAKKRSKPTSPGSSTSKLRTPSGSVSGASLAEVVVPLGGLRGRSPCFHARYVKLLHPSARPKFEGFGALNHRLRSALPCRRRGSLFGHLHIEMKSKASIVGRSLLKIYLFQPARLLERGTRGEAIGPGHKGADKSCERMAVKAGSLAHSSPEVRRAHAQRGVPSRPALHAA